MHILTIRAYAKLNLYLEVLGRRTDGFHRLETIFQTIGLFDDIEILHEAGYSGISLSCNDASIPTDASNLVWRAAAAFIAGREAQAGHFTISLQKGIPHGAGLGGGSSDAAAVLRALAQFFPGWHDATSLQRLAAGLGSDVPFFLLGGTALGEERGEVLTALGDLPSTVVTVMMPPERLPTPIVFAALTPEERGPRAGRGVAWWRQQAAHADWSSLLFNRLTAAAIRRCPQVDALLSHLQKKGATSLMSGSGAACFALGSYDPPAGMTAWQTTTISRAVALTPAKIH